MEIEKRGIPTVTVCTTEFASLGRQEATALGIVDLALSVVPHPLGGIQPSQVQAKATLAMDDIVKRLTTQVVEVGTALETAPSSRYLCQDNVCAYVPTWQDGGPESTLTVEDSLEAANDSFYARHWTDGLPIVPPTRERVDRMLQAVKQHPQQVIGVLPPRNGIATVEAIAINAVMAGCLPAYLPVLLAAVEVMAEPRFNLYGVQATTGPHAPLVIVNGPVVKELGFNFGHNAFGPGWRANASVGRAIRLILLNLGGAIPGTVDKATQGQPSKYAFCIAENEEANPWEPLHVERGFQRDTSTVTVIAGEANHNVNEHVNTTARGVLTTIVDTMANMGTAKLYRTSSESLILLCPEHASIIAKDNWTKSDIRQFVIETGRRPFGEVKRGGMFGAKGYWPKWVDTSDDATMIPLHENPEDIVIVVVGGAGRHSSFIPTWGQSRSMTRPILLA